jgi:DNA-binding NarL/FixJ family response regulator
LIVDDHPGIRHALRTALTRAEGFRVAGETGRGADLPQMLQHYRPDLVVLDLELEPGHKPADSIEIIYRLLPQAKVAIYSGHQDAELIRHMLALGANGYIHKRDALADVLQALRLIAQGESYISSHLMVDLTYGPMLEDVELEVLAMLADDEPTPRIAIRLHCSERTVRRYLSSAMVKLHATTRSGAVAAAMRKGFIV